MWRRSSEEAGKAIFLLADELLKAAALPLSAIQTFIFDAGPGSMLGIRTCAMALRTWQALSPRPAYQYQSLTLLAHDLAQKGVTGAVIADARRETWHAVEFAAPAQVRPLRRVPAAELAEATIALWQPTSFRAWGKLTCPTADCSYDVAQLLTEHAEVDLFTAADAPDAFQHEAPEYKKWSAQVHSAVTAPPR